MLDQILLSLPSYLETALAVIGGAAVIVKGFAEIAKITPTTKDDALASKAEVVLSYVLSFLDKLSLGLKDTQARK
jgi:hypothetical protein